MESASKGKVTTPIRSLLNGYALWQDGLEEKIAWSVCEIEFTMEIELRDSFEVRNVLPKPRTPWQDARGIKQLVRETAIEHDHFSACAQKSIAML